MLVLQPIHLNAGVRDIIGTLGVKYQQANQVFPRGSSLAQGFVRFNNGVTIASGSAAQLDTFITVSGSMDIRNTGTLDLLSDLYLSSHFTFSSSDFLAGFIKGRGNTIHFGGDTRLQQGQTLKFIGNTIIDGGGNSFIFDPYAQILVDYGVTVTLKNMQFINYRNSTSRPSISLLSQSSKLALQNVKFSLLDNFAFNEGSLFIHDDVIVTGSSMFSYQSAQPCVISSQSTWLFDNGTTYFHNPKTTVNTQLFMTDQTSTFAFNNATLLTTHTGMRIAGGVLCLDNGVTFSSTANTRLVGMSQLGSSNTDINSTMINAVVWSNSGKYVAMAAVDTTIKGRLEVSTFNGTALVNGQAFVDSNFVIPYAMAWTNDDRFIVMVGEDIIPEGVLQLYQFTGTSLIRYGNVVIDANFAHIYSVAWSIDGKYLIAVGQDASLGTSRYSIYAFNGVSLSLLTTATDGDFYAMLSISWSPDNNHVVIGGYGGGSGALKVYTFNSGTLTAVGSVFVAINFITIRSCQWSPDGNFIMTAGQNISVFSFGQTQLFSFNGSSLNSIAGSFNSDLFTNIVSSSWSPDGRRIIVGGVGSTFSLLQTFVFNGVSVIPVEPLINNSDFFVINGLSWSADNKSILIGGQNLTTEGETALYQASYGYDSAPQGFANGIVFGNSALGAIYDLNVEVFGGARVVIDGKLLYDNVV